MAKAAPLKRIVRWFLCRWLDFHSWEPASFHEWKLYDVNFKCRRCGIKVAHFSDT